MDKDKEEEKKKKKKRRNRKRKKNHTFPGIKQHIWLSTYLLNVMLRSDNLVSTAVRMSQWRKRGWFFRSDSRLGSWLFTCNNSIGRWTNFLISFSSPSFLLSFLFIYLSISYHIYYLVINFVMSISNKSLSNDTHWMYDLKTC